MLEGKIKTFGSINGKSFRTYEDCFFPPILDDDPEEAARSLTIKDAEDTYEALTYIFGTTDRCNKYSLLHHAVYYNNFSFTWFYSFYICIVKECGKLLFRSPPDNYEDFLNKRSTDDIKVFNPFFVLPDGDRYVTHEEDFVKSSYSCVLQDVAVKSEGGPNKRTRKIWVGPSVVELYRIKYIKEEYEVQEFKSGYPLWYKLPVKVFERYNPFINRRVQIQYVDGEFRYYIAGASDNWQEIFDVPLEIDDVIKTILFRS